MRYHRPLLSFFIVTAIIGLFTAALAPAPCHAAKTEGGYLVVVSKATYALPEWKKVVDALVKKHDAKVVVYQHSVNETLGELQKEFPRYACFVARPEEAGFRFVEAVHLLTRKLDDDPYADLFWGILSGYDADAAMRIATYSKPLTVRRVAAGTDFAMEMVEEGIWYSELKKNHMVRKLPGKKPTAEKGPADTTKALVEVLNNYKPQLFITSGHASSISWQIGYNYRNGWFRCKDGKLYGEDSAKKIYKIDSPNPKVYMPVGNCSLGHITGRNAITPAWMNNGGVKQMFGYTRPTWFGYAGWGCLDYFVEQPGRYTFTEAFFANHHALIYRLQTDAANSRGMKYDRDVLAFYGDPAWVARMKAMPDQLAWKQTLTEKDGVYTFTLTPQRGDKTFDPINTNGSQRGGRPIVAFFPHRLKEIKIIEGSDLKPVITDNFLLFPNPNPHPKKKGPQKKIKVRKSYRIIFKAKEVK